MQKSNDNKTTVKLSENELWGAPPSNDGAFLVALRERMSPRRSAPLWLSGRALAGVSAVCALLLAAIWLPGDFNGEQLPTDYLTIESVLHDADSASIDPTELAAFLGVELDENSESDEVDYSVEVFAADELNSMNDAEFEAMLSNLEQARFF